MKGKLIVIDGTDGSGKATQTKQLKQRLESEGYRVQTLDFPRYYDNFFGEFIGKGLKGDFGDWVGLHPKVASVMYACDRFESKSQIEEWLKQGYIVILDRYVSSNQIHQGGKINDDLERKEFLQWLDKMEHEVFALPRPDLILYLDVKVELTQDLIHQKQNQQNKAYLKGQKDQHEGDLKHLEDARESGLRMIAENNNWVSITCTNKKRILSIKSINDLISEEVKKIF